MPSGGARARSGPPPESEALTRDKVRKSAAKGEWVTLPAAGRSGKAPTWPLARPKAPTKVELKEIETLTEAIASPEKDDPIERWERKLRTLEAKVEAHATNKRELVIWGRLWKKPQAIAWEANGQEDEVALYVRSLVAAEQLDSSVAARTLIRQQQEALGLSLPGLARNRWTIAEVDDSARPMSETAAASATTEERASARDRFGVIDGGQT